MSIDNDPAVTRVTVVLDKPADWHSWLFIRKDTCLQHNLWEFVNPDTPDAEQLTLSPPVKPKPADYKAGCTRFCQLGAEDRESFKWDHDNYQTEYLDYKKKAQALAEITLDIGKTIAKRHIYLIENADKAHERLHILKKHLAPTDTSRRYELIAKYNSLKTIPKAAKNLEGWLASWISTVA